MCSSSARQLLLSLLLLVVAPATTSAAQCTASGAHLSVTTSTNASGHWTTALRLAQETRLPARPSAVSLDVRPMTSRCRGVRTNSLLVTLQGPPAPAGPGYEELQGAGFYKLHQELATWDEAKSACESEDAHLLVLNSEQEAAAIKQLIARYPKITSWLHIGFNDKEIEGTHVTIFGETLAAAGFATWSPNQPDDAGGSEDCGSVHPKTALLNDILCGRKLPFICEQIVY